ncbi:MAG: Flagellar hook-length control protein FliK, partial [Myxococcaceae bacterium]|nr:Flagellar hook-length control protein FliK [Myxococcaceae bacterium]
MNPMHWWHFAGDPRPAPPPRREDASGWRSTAVALALAVGCAPDSIGPPTEHRSPSPMATRMAAPFDVAAAIDRVRFAFRADRDGWSGGHDTYAAHATGSALAVTPLLHEEAPAPGAGDRMVAGAEATFHAASVARGSVRLTACDGAGTVDRDGHLTVDRGAVVEEFENRPGGVEQRWSFARRPAAAGDLTVRIAVTGEDFASATPSGLHFRDARTGLGVRYGHGTWVDAAGARTPVLARWDGAAIVLTVPSAVVDGAAYPAALDPAIAPEFGVDQAPPGPADGTSPALASDGHDFLLVWQSGYAIVGAWLGPNGCALDTGSFVLSTNHFGTGITLNNQAPSIASNGHGFLVAWIADYYTGTVDISDVRAVRVDQEDGVLDAEDLLLGRAPIDRGSVQSIDVGSNGRDYLVAWRYSLSMDHVLGARVSAAGVLLGTTSIAVAARLGAPRVASDGTNYIVAMGRTGVRVDATGTLLDPAPLSLPGGDAIIFDGEDYVLAWSERRAGAGSDLFAARVSTDGSVRDPAGIAISTAPNEQRTPVLAFDGRDIIVGWTDTRASNDCDPCAIDPGNCSPCRCNAACLTEPPPATALYAARLARSGLVRDPDGIALTVPARGARPLVLASNDAGTLLGWAGAPQTAPDGPAAIYGAWLTRAGVVRTLRDPVLAHATDDQRVPAVAADGDGGFLVVWQGFHNRAPAGATRAFSWDVLGARVGAFGAFGTAVVISDAAGDQVAPAVTFAAGRYLVAWQDHRGDSWDIYGARVTRGGVVRDPAGIALTTAPDQQTSPSVAGGMVAWTDTTAEGATSVRGARVSATGVVQDRVGLAFSATGESAGSPAIAADRTGYRIAWTRTGASSRQVVTARIDAAGVVHDVTAMPVPVPGRYGPTYDISPSVACGGGGCLVAWSQVNPDLGSGTYLGSASEIYGVLADRLGTLSMPSPIALLPPRAVNPFGARFTQYGAPRVAADGDGFLVVWESRHGEGFVRRPFYDVLATRVSADTSPSAEAFAVASDDVWTRTP